MLQSMRVADIYTCEACAGRYEPVHKAQRFCSRSCANAERRVPERACRYCGAIFKPARHKQMFCSPPCRDKGRSRRQPKPKPLRPCQQCGTEFEALWPGTARFCSKACRDTSLNVPVGSKRMNNTGYVLVRVQLDHPQASPKSNGWVLEHRLVMADLMGRPLRPHETVHHIDGNRTNNDPSNLQLRQGKHGHGSVVVCLDCGSHNVGFAAIADPVSTNTNT